MYLDSLDVTDLRIIRHAELRPEPRLNVIYGRNGSGKTSLLEAIALLGLGRSFATHRLQDTIRRGATRLTVVAALRRAGGLRMRVGIERGRSQSRLLVDGQEQRNATAFMRECPILVLGTHSLDLLRGGPRERRNLIDRTLFHVEPDYLRLWREYHHAVRQRNSLLRAAAQRADFHQWHALIAARGERIHRLREAGILALSATLPRLTSEVFPGRISLEYRAGWAAGNSLSEALEQALDGDRRTCVTSVGPHRADTRIAADDAPAQGSLSRGQGKLLVGALLVAQAGLIRERTGISPIVLIDDLSAELDTDSQAALLSAASEAQGQLFVTRIDAGALPPGIGDARWFHVEHGVVTQV